MFCWLLLTTKNTVLKILQTYHCPQHFSAIPKELQNIHNSHLQCRNFLKFTSLSLLRITSHQTRDVQINAGKHYRILKKTPYTCPPTTGNGCLELQHLAYKSLSPVKQKTKLVYSGKTCVRQYKSTSSVTG